MSLAASFGRVVATRAASETRLTLRRGENLLAMVGLPAAALAFFATIGSGGGSRSIETLLPGVLALALVASGLVNLGIATAFERGYGVLKRLGGSPLGRDGLITAKLAVVGVIALVQVAVLIILAIVLGWQPGPEVSVVAVGATVVIGSAAFAAIGLLLAGTLRPEATLVVANTLFLVALLLGGVLVPLGELPEPLATIALISPVGALAEAFRVALGDGAGSLGRSRGRRGLGRDRAARRDPHLPLGVIENRTRYGDAIGYRARPPWACRYRGPVDQRGSSSERSEGDHDAFAAARRRVPSRGWTRPPA